MTELQMRIVAEARSWIGTPYRHQGTLRGAGSDCLGLLRGVWRTLYGDEPERVPPYTEDWAEPTRQEVLSEAADRWLWRKALDDGSPGDVLLFRMRDDGIAKHLGIAAEVGAAPTFVHAYSGHGVIESPLSAPWARRIVGRFAFPNGVK
jgi:NlpC/P60 family putative phage cell wall peptidase